jgi:hypothetical protein
LWNLALEGITSFSAAPLKLATLLGLITSLGAFSYGSYFLLRTLLLGNPVPGYPSLVVIMLFLGGVQLVCLGIIGEYLARTYNESKGRQLYFVMDYLPSALPHRKNGRHRLRGRHRSRIPMPAADPAPAATPLLDRAWPWQLAGALICLSFGFTEMMGSDLWWHLAAGREIIQTGTLWLVDDWSFTELGSPWHNHEWLADLLFYGWASLLGVPSLVYWKWLLIIASFGLLQHVLTRVSGSARRRCWRAPWRWPSRHHSWICDRSCTPCSGWRCC